MFNFFRKSQDSKKVSLPEREADGFVLLGMSSSPDSGRYHSFIDGNSWSRVIQLMNREEHLKIKMHFLRQNLHTVNLFRIMVSTLVYLSVFTIPNTEKHSHLTVAGAEEGNESQHLESNHFMSEFLSDVPFTLAPHVLAVQDTSNGLPDQLLSYNINDNLSRFWYDFTLENSVLCDL
ncbi:UBAP1-MVB12-associated (UMA)-domain containing protein 1 isoform X2 [Trachemys scripta elegans]|uniref:UBAP1-MVB12-associated (UMA)-domain containing protein 1 isoform X2 n=1 Tax=Trachemys scripta elegans TaxID=31138 RepID=UPI0015582B9B|nr:UBAP1-MVB12-associated (UMA)-domain containing protein 1 isoform X2 [Trachemys scripta elegans]